MSQSDSLSLHTSSNLLIPKTISFTRMRATSHLFCKVDSRPMTLVKAKGTLVLICLLFATFFTNIYAQEGLKRQQLSRTDIISSKVLKEIKKNLQDFPDSTELSIALIQDGKPTYFGILKNNDSLFIVNNESHIFEIGSITKVFTSTILANAILENKVTSKQDVADFLDYPLHKNISLSFLSLANHTSGLPRLSPQLMMTAVFSNNPYKSFDDDEMQMYLESEMKLIYKAGDKNEYSNMGAGILGYSLEQVYGDKIEGLFQKKIFEKYNMHNTTSQLNKIKGTKTEARDANGKTTPYWEMNALVGAGGLYSSADQLSNFAIAQWDEENKELVLTQQETYRMSDKIAIGLAWHLITAKDGRKILWHNGGTAGSTSYLAVDLENKNAAIILSNVSAFHFAHSNIDALGFELLKRLATMNE